MLSPCCLRMISTRSRRLAGLRLLFDGVIQGPVLQVQIGVHLLKTPILLLQFLGSPYVGRFHAAILEFPLVAGGVAETVLPANLIHHPTRFHFPQNPDDLVLAES